MAVRQELIISPLVIKSKEPTKISIKLGERELEPHATQFKAVENNFVKAGNKYQNPYIVFDPETLNVTPLKSGKTKLKIEYRENETATPAIKEIDVTVGYKEVYPTLSVMKKDGTLALLSGESKNIDFEFIDLVSEQTGEKRPVKLSVSPPVVVDVPADPASGAMTIKAHEIDSSTRTTITPSVDGVEYKPITVEVAAAVKGFDITVDKVKQAKQAGKVKITIPEGETRVVSINVVGREGAAAEMKGFSIQYPDANFVRVTPKDGDYELTAQSLRTTTPQTTTMAFVAEGQGVTEEGAVADVKTELEITVVPQRAYINLVARKGENFLLPNGRVVIDATVMQRENNGSFRALSGLNVDFELEDDKNRVWVDLTEENNTATVVWREPSDEQIRAAYNGVLERRPAQVVVLAKAVADGVPVRSSTAVRMGKVAKFAPLRVKLNIMDERTASDLYGTVMSREYYVLTVRLFNNLKDQDTQEYIGSSILAYSASIEVAVGMEKKFDRNGTDSFFPNIIGGGAASEIAKQRARGAEEVEKLQATSDINAAKKAQEELKRASDAEFDAYKKATEAVSKANASESRAAELKGRADVTNTPADRRAATTAIAQANADYDAADAAIERSQQAHEYTGSVRAAIANAIWRRSPVSRALAGYSDPDTAIDDSKWHPVTREDLERIATAKPAQPNPSTPLKKLKRASFLNSTAGADERRAGGADAIGTPETPAEPSCVSDMITYRPFSFEMMVNTVDRRDDRSSRNVAFKILDFIGTGTSFVTAVAVPGNSSDLPLGLEKYRNLLIPGLDRLITNYKEQHRQNIVSQAMKEIEEIPFGSDITRVIFIPKKSIRGVVRGHETRISEICPFYFSVEVAIIEKGREPVRVGAIESAP